MRQTLLKFVVQGRSACVYEEPAGVKRFEIFSSFPFLVPFLT
jgi:hypothetical protein